VFFGFACTHKTPGVVRQQSCGIDLNSPSVCSDLDEFLEGPLDVMHLRLVKSRALQQPGRLEVKRILKPSAGSWGPPLTDSQGRQSPEVFVTDSLLQELAFVLGTNGSSVKSLDLSCNNLGAACAALAPSLSKMTSLEHLDLSQCNLCGYRNARNAAALVPALKVKKNRRGRERIEKTLRLILFG
jgi:hypothetical protein